jgi:PTS system glucitol/sorbitol-specific IIA component
VPGAELQLGELRYPVTAVGDVAEQNLRELGHITLRFDGHREAEFPEPYTWRARCRKASPPAAY